MTEKTIDNKIDKSELLEGTRIFYFRHSMAKYGEFAKKLASDNPIGPLDIEAQQPDLTTGERDGALFAHEQAVRFFDSGKMNPDKDAFFIVSSDQIRALETAAIYAQVARNKGFRVIAHKNTGTEIARKLDPSENEGEGYVRSLETLSLNDIDSLTEAVYNPPEQLSPVNWEAVEKIEPGFKEKWDKARAIVLEYNESVKAKGGRPSWGDNSYHCSAKVKKFLPAAITPEDQMKRFKQMLRLARFAQNRPTDGEKMNVLAFGHENAPAAALEEHTGKHALANCEGFEVVDGKPVRVVLES